ncbi:unnamed protein product [Rotaria socialis]|uniref:Uncharacterized protein n=1 Tax=Rotaria socialis TaxID=392032 RepID=A0A818ZH00_9BILA|nr:unnamed protein product [Rotaria socialis]CAF4814609.1 unnamed protein product [Rotaria socialis]
MQKVIVIPYGLFTKWQTKQKESDKHDKRLADLELGLNKILKSGKTNDYKKIHYVEALRKFLQENRKMDDDTSDIRLAIEDEKTHSASDPLYNSLKNKILVNNILKRGQTLYKNLSSSPHINWTDNGVIMLQGNTIQGSNITDLIAGALDQTFSDQNPSAVGIDAFEKWIRKLKGPKYVMTKTSLPSQSIMTTPRVTQASRKSVVKPRLSPQVDPYKKTYAKKKARKSTGPTYSTNWLTYK